MSENFNIILTNQVKNIAKENNLEPEIVKDFLIDAIKKAYNRSTFEDNLEINFDLNTGSFNAFKLFEVVDGDSNDLDEYLQIANNNPKISGMGLKNGDLYKEPFHIEKEFSQNQVQQILQSFKQRIIEINNQRVYKSWARMKNEVILAEVEKEDRKSGSYTINLDNVYDKNGEKLEGTLGFINNKELGINEKLLPGKKYHFVVVNIKEQSKFCPVILSRNSNKLVEYYMALEIPEIDDGTIKIVKSARQAGIKTKVLVDSKTLPTEPAAICVGPRGERVKSISNKLNNEKIEIYNYTSNPYLLLSQIIIKSGIIKMAIDEKSRNAVVVVHDDELSKAIGKRGCNAKLASIVSDYNIDIIKFSDFDIEDYDMRFYDIDSEEFQDLCTTSNNGSPNINQASIQEMDSFLEQMGDNEENEEMVALNDIFEEELNQILTNEKNKF